MHLSQAFLLKLGVADREHLIDNENFGLEVRGDREGEADIHAAAVTFDRCVEKFLGLGKGDDLIELRLNLMAPHPEDRAVQENVFAAGQLGMKPRADFKQRSDSSFDPHFAFGRFGDAAERIFSSVDFPAPLRPMMPTTSPRFTSKLILRKAQKSSFEETLKR